MVGGYARVYRRCCTRLCEYCCHRWSINITKSKLNAWSHLRVGASGPIDCCPEHGPVEEVDRAECSGPKNEQRIQLTREKVSTSGGTWCYHGSVGSIQSPCNSGLGSYACYRHSEETNRQSLVILCVRFLSYWLFCPDSVMFVSLVLELAMSCPRRTVSSSLWERLAHWERTFSTRWTENWSEQHFCFYRLYTHTQLWENRVSAPSLRRLIESVPPQQHKPTVI